ncbi:MAG: addiction module protein [Gammaproteobacteria bacterium]|nr:addiction module protein [Gammaproteobacteria bacterium]
MTNVSISKMSIEEKISTLEMIWNDLCQHTTLESPDWHQDVLKVRKQKRASSQEQPMDWSEAKKNILNRTK